MMPGVWTKEDWTKILEIVHSENNGREFLPIISVIISDCNSFWFSKNNDKFLRRFVLEKYCYSG